MSTEPDRGEKSGNIPDQSDSQNHTNTSDDLKTSSLAGNATQQEGLGSPENTKEHITVLGAGSFGTAIGAMFARNGHRVTILDRPTRQDRVDHINQQHKNPDYMADTILPPMLFATVDPEVAFRGSTYVFHAIPIQASKDYLATFKTYITKSVPIISMSKGIHCETLQFMNDIIYEVFGRDQQCAFLSGPSFAKEILQQQPTGFVLASEQEDVRQRIAQLIAGDKRARVWTTSDVIGVEVGGALKNIYAIGAGIVEGYGFGYNPTAMLVTRGCSEMRKLAVALGARSETLSGLSGIGDLMLTCFGPASRNRTVGVRIGRGESLEDIAKSMREVAEGVPTLLAARRLVHKLGEKEETKVEVPLLMTICATVHDGLSVEGAMKQLLSLPVVEED